MAVQSMSADDAQKVAAITSFFGNRLLLKKYRSEGRKEALPEDVAICEKEFEAIATEAVRKTAAESLDAVEWARLCAEFSKKWIEVCHWVSPKKFREFLSETLNTQWVNEEHIEASLELPPVDLKWYKNPEGCIPVQPCICPVCRVFCNSMSQYKAHTQGRIHRSLERKFSKKNGGKRVEPVMYESEEQLQEWRVDDRQKWKSKKDGSKSAATNDATTSASTSVCTSASTSVSKAPSADSLSKEPLLPVVEEPQSPVKKVTPTLTRTNEPYATGVVSPYDEPFWVNECEVAQPPCLPPFEAGKQGYPQRSFPLHCSEAFRTPVLNPCGPCAANSPALHPVARVPSPLYPCSEGSPALHPCTEIRCTSPSPSAMHMNPAIAHTVLLSKPGTRSCYVNSPYGDVPPEAAAHYSYLSCGRLTLSCQ